MLDPDAALKIKEVWLGVSVPPPLAEPNVKETLMVPVTLEFAVEVRVTVAVYVWPDTIPAVWLTARDTVGVDAPVTLSQLGPGWLVPVYVVAVVNATLLKSDIATETPVAWLLPPSVTAAVLVTPFRTNVCARPGTTMRSAVARNRTVLLKYV